MWLVNKLRDGKCAMGARSNAEIVCDVIYVESTVYPERENWTILFNLQVSSTEADDWQSS